MFTRLLRRYAELSYNKLVTNLTSTPKAKPSDLTKVPFGTVFTDHMIEADWCEDQGWSEPVIKPYQKIPLDPSSSVFHYCTECYEGFKVYSNPPHILSFRPMTNMERFVISADAAGLPKCSPHELLKCIDELIRIDKDWVPQVPGYTLYVRPNMFGTHAQLSVTKPKKAKLVVIMSLVGPYFPTGYKPISLYCDESLIRSWTGGHGHRKIGGNYGPAIVPAEKVKNLGYDNILWLSEGHVTEVGVMNFFVLFKNKNGLELVTSPIHHTVLPGITRDSVIQLIHEWGEVKMSERDFTIKELVAKLEEGNVVEAFGSGTAAVICPINKLAYKGKEYNIPTVQGNCGELTKRIFDELTKIQYGKVKHKWNHYIA
jgi:branched-chain amino acid aminotransferase